MMQDHYFTEKPTVPSDPQQFQVTLKGIALKVTTDRGVFSKAEVDFGTRQLIEAFELPEVEGAILDIGCGYGPIGLTLAKKYQDRQIMMIDINERAIELAKKNSQDNQIENVVIRQSNLFSEVKENSFASMLTNPPIRAGKDVVHRLFAEAYEHLTKDGELWVVIQKKQGAPSAIKKLESLFGSVHTMARSKGYYILKAKKI